MIAAGATPAVYDPAIAEAARLLLSQDFQASLWSGIVLLALGFVLRVFDARPRLVWGLGHQFAFDVVLDPNQPPNKPVMTVYTRTMHVSNEGSAPAEEVEIHLVGKPQHYQVWPPFDYEPVFPLGGGFIIRVRNLGVKERVAVEMLHIEQAPPDILRVRSKRGEAKQVLIVPTRQVGTAVRWTAYALFLIGAFTLLRLLFETVLRAV